MKSTVFSLLLILSVGLSACGQKGALFLPETSGSKSTASASAKDIQPKMVTISAFTISGSRRELTENSAAGWKSLFASLEVSNNLIRYVAFDTSPVDNYPVEQSAAENSAAENPPTPTLTVVVGTPQKKNINGQVKTAVDGGRYLRFASRNRGVTDIPTLIEHARSHLQTTSDIKHGTAGDFIIESQHAIELYISVTKHTEKEQP